MHNNTIKHLCILSIVIGYQLATIEADQTKQARTGQKGKKMIPYEFSLLATSCKTVNDFVAAFYDKKSVHYSTSNIRKEYCDKCQNMDCENCFIHDSLVAIYEENPFA